MSHDLVELGAATLSPTTNALAVQCKAASLSDEDGDAPDYGDVMFACALGLAAMPYPATADGAAEAIVATDVPGLDGVMVGARDTRTAKIYGNLKPGDTALHSTGPQMAAQVQCKEEKRQVCMVTKDTAGKTMIALLDGAGDKVQISGFGLMFEMSKEQGIVLSSGGATLQIKDGVISLAGQVVLGGRTPVGYVQFSPSLTPVVGVTGGCSPSPGVFVGA